MFKAGLLGGLTGFIYVTSLNIFSPFCTLFITPILGLGVGYLAGWFDEPMTRQASIGRGVMAGTLTSGFVVCGQAIATLVNATIITNWEEWPTTVSSFGLSPAGITDYDYWQATLITNTLCGLFNVIIIIGLAAIGSLFRFQRKSNHKENL